MTAVSSQNNGTDSARPSKKGISLNGTGSKAA